MSGLRVGSGPEDIDTFALPPSHTYDKDHHDFVAIPRSAEKSPRTENFRKELRDLEAGMVRSTKRFPAQLKVNPVFNDRLEAPKPFFRSKTENRTKRLDPDFAGLPHSLKNLPPIRGDLSSLRYKKTDEFIALPRSETQGFQDETNDQLYAEFPERLMPFALLKTSFKHDSFRLLDKRLKSFNPSYLLDAEAFSCYESRILDSRLKKVASLIANFPLEGQLSPKFKLWSSSKARKEAQIPIEAVWCCYSYPLDVLWKSGQAEASLRSHNLEHLSELYFLMTGGYMYFDKYFKIVQVNAIQSLRRWDEYDEPEQEDPGILRFSLPSEFPPAYIDNLVREDRVKPVRFKAMRSKGAKFFAWIGPNEEFTDVQRNRRNFGRLGGFLFLFHSLYERDAHLTAKNKFFAVVSGSSDRDLQINIFPADHYITKVMIKPKLMPDWFEIMDPERKQKIKTYLAEEISKSTDKDSTENLLKLDMESFGLNFDQSREITDIYAREMKEQEEKNAESYGSDDNSDTSQDWVDVDGPKVDHFEAEPGKSGHTSIGSDIGRMKMGNSTRVLRLDELPGDLSAARYIDDCDKKVAEDSDQIGRGRPIVRNFSSMRASQRITDQVDLDKEERYFRLETFGHTLRKKGRIAMDRDEHIAKLSWEIVKHLWSKYALALADEAKGVVITIDKRPLGFDVDFNPRTKRIFVSRIDDLIPDVREGYTLLKCNDIDFEGMDLHEGWEVLQKAKLPMTLKLLHSSWHEECDDDSDSGEEDDKYIHMPWIIKNALFILVGTLHKEILEHLMREIEAEENCEKAVWMDLKSNPLKIIALEQGEAWATNFEGNMRQIRAHTKDIIKRSVKLQDTEPMQRMQKMLLEDAGDLKMKSELLEKICGSDWFDVLLENVLEQLQTKLIKRKELKILDDYLNRDMIVKEFVKRIKYARLPDEEVKAIVEARAKEKNWLRNRSVVRFLEHALENALSGFHMERERTDTVVFSYRIGQIPEEILEFIEIGVQPIPTFQYLVKDMSVYSLDLDIVKVPQCTLSSRGSKARSMSKMAMASFIDTDGKEAKVRIRGATAGSKPVELKVDLNKVQRKFTWFCWRCGNSKPYNWRDIYEEKNWVCCMTCGLVTTKTMEKFNKKNQYIKRWVVMKAIYGSVYAGYDSQRNMAVAVKVCDKELMRQKAYSCKENPMQEYKYHREICNFAYSQRPVGLLAFIDHMETDKSLDIILEWANGGELFQHVVNYFRKNPDIWNKPRALRRWKLRSQALFKEICLGIKHLHNRGFVHRDLSLENVLLMRELPSKPRFLRSRDNADVRKLGALYESWQMGNESALMMLEIECGSEAAAEEYLKWRNNEKIYRAKVCDFGLMVQDNREGNHGRYFKRVGKKRYMSPECYDGDYDGKKNDVHCLGVLLLMMLIGIPPITCVRDSNYQWLLHSKEARIFLVNSFLPKGRRSQLVSDEAWEVLGRIFTKESERASIDELLETDYLKNAPDPF